MMQPFRCLYCYLWTYFTPCYSVSIVNFEHQIAGWVCNKTTLIQQVYGIGHAQKKVALHDIAKIEKSQIFYFFENEASYGDFAHKCFKSCYGYFVTFSVKIWSKEAQGYKSDILLLLYQYVFTDAFFRESIIEIWEINPWRTNSSFTEIFRYFCNIGTKTRKWVVKFD